MPRERFLQSLLKSQSYLYIKRFQSFQLEDQVVVVQVVSLREAIEARIRSLPSKHYLLNLVDEFKITETTKTKPQKERI